MLIYLDSVILIYFLDAAGPLHHRASQRLARLHAEGDRVAVSDLTRLECRVHPIQQADRTRLAIFDGFFAQPDVTTVPLSPAVYDRATLIRARFAFKTIDALHLAAAIESGCSSMLTNDTRLARFPDLTVEVLP